VQRALFEDLDQWATNGKKPPDSEVPTFKDHQLVSPLPQDKAASPDIPGVTYTGLKTTRYRMNYGPNFYATGNSDDQPARHHVALRGQSRECADLSVVRAEDRQGWQRDRRHPPARGRSAAGDIHRLGVARRSAGE
jgi:hypothetical protein